MDIETLQVKYDFKVQKLPCFDQFTFFFLNTKDKLSIFKCPIFAIFSKIVNSGRYGEEKKEEFLTALFIEAINCFSFPDIINEATHIYVLGEFELTEETSKKYFQTLSWCKEIKMQVPVKNPYGNI